MGSDKQPRLAITHRGVGATLLVLGLLLAACNGGAENPPDEEMPPASSETADEDDGEDADVDQVARGEELRIGVQNPPSNLDPAHGSGAEVHYLSLAYDPLILAATDGSFQPRLAQEWTEIGGDNTEFEIVLREGVVFSDGAALNAEAVEANINYYREAGGQSATRLSAITSMEVVDELTLRLTFADPEPRFEELFSQGGLAGRMISPEAIEESARLATETVGAGPYILVVEETVDGDTYTYDPNPNFWDPQLIHWERVTIKVLPDDTTRLAALTTGQVDVVRDLAGGSVAQGAEGSGMQVAVAPGIVSGIQLNDREGELLEPLGDVRVRQALNFAVDRAAITEAVVGEHGIPTEQPAAPGGVGYNEQNFYTYDPDRARDLLAEAGYEDGFTLPVYISSNEPTLFEAIAADLAQVGVTVEIVTGEAGEFFERIGDYPATVMGWGVLHPHRMGRDLWLADATGINPFNSSDPTIEQLDRDALTADPDTQDQLYEDMIAHLVEQAWFLPISLRPLVYFHNDTVTIDGQPGGNYPSPESWQPTQT